MEAPSKLHSAKCTPIFPQNALSELEEIVTPAQHSPKQAAEAFQDTNTQTLPGQLPSSSYPGSSHAVFLGIREIKGDFPILRLRTPQSTQTASAGNTPGSQASALPCSGWDCWSRSQQIGTTLAIIATIIAILGVLYWGLCCPHSKIRRRKARRRRRRRDKDVEERRQDWEIEGNQLDSIIPVRTRRSDPSMTLSEDVGQVSPTYGAERFLSQRQHPLGMAQKTTYPLQSNRPPGPIVGDFEVPAATLAGAYGAAAVSRPRGLASQSGPTTERDMGRLQEPPVAAYGSHHRGDARIGRYKRSPDNDFDEFGGRRRSEFHTARDSRQNAYTYDELEEDEMGRIRRERIKNRESKKERGKRERERGNGDEKYDGDGDDENKRTRKQCKDKQKKKRNKSELEDILDGPSKWLAILPLAFRLLHDWTEPKGGWTQHHSGNQENSDKKGLARDALIDSNKGGDYSWKADRGRSRQKRSSSRDDKRSLVDRNRLSRHTKRREEERSQSDSRDDRYEGRHGQRPTDEGRQRSADDRQVHGESTKGPLTREGYLPRRRTTRRDARSRHDADNQMSPPHARFRDTVSVASPNRNSNVRHILLNDIPRLPGDSIPPEA